MVSGGSYKRCGYQIWKLGGFGMSKESELKVIHFDLEKKVFEVNGVPLPNDCDKLDLSFENGAWILTYNSRITLSRR